MMPLVWLFAIWGIAMATYLIVRKCRRNDRREAESRN